MADPEPTTPKPEGPAPEAAPKTSWLTTLAPLIGVVKLDWLKAVMNNVGGRKVTVFGIAVYGILALAAFVESGVLTGWHLVGVAGAIAFLGAVTNITIAWEDRAKAAAAAEAAAAKGKI